MLKSMAMRKSADRSRLSMKFWSVAAAFAASLGFMLFQGGKLALMLFVIISILSVYLLLGQWSGIKRTQGQRSLQHSGDYTAALEAGSSLGVTIQLQIPGFWPMPYLFVKDRLVRRNGGEMIFEATVVPDWRRRGVWEYRTPALRRGYYSFGHTECVTEDIFGLFEHSGTLNLPTSIAVLPKTVPIREWQQHNHMMKGTNHHSTTTRAVRETTQINGVREYNYGDRISRIHWNATAKTGTWKSKEFERESLPKTFLVLDRELAAYGHPDHFELGVSAAASLFQYGAQRGLALGLVSSGADDAYFEPKIGQMQYKALQQHMIDVEADGVKPLRLVLKDKVKQIPPGSFVAIISPGSGEPMAQLLGWLKQSQLNPCHIWLCPQAEAEMKEAWIGQLRSRGMTGYAISHLAELPAALGGRGA